MRPIMLVALAPLPLAVLLVLSADAMAQQQTQAGLLKAAKAAYGDTCECVNTVLGKTGTSTLAQYRDESVSVPDIGLQLETIRFTAEGKVLSVDRRPLNIKEFRKVMPDVAISKVEVTMAKKYNPWDNKGVWISRQELKPSQLRPDLVVQTNIDGQKLKTHIHNKECECVDCAKIEVDKTAVRKVVQEVDQVRRQQTKTKNNYTANVR